MPTNPTMIEMDMKDLEDALRRAEANELTEEDCASLRTLFLSYFQLLELLKNKNTSIGRLRKMLFGAKTEKIATLLAHANASPSASKSDAADSSTPATGNTTKDAKTPRKSHGRNGANAYTGAEKVAVKHESLQPGDPCPNCSRGTLYEMTRPGVLLRFTGQPPIQAMVYEIQKLRCNLCSDIFSAKPPEGVGAKKYDATAGSMMAMLKYSMGVPFHREEKFQECLGIPLPASTQWEIVEMKAEKIEPAFRELMCQAADGEVVFNDDTTVKILELMDKRAAQEAVTKDDAMESTDHATSDRRGMYTTGIVSTGTVSTGEGHKIALFLSGRKHAGENLKDVLVRRAKDLPPPIQMCDALCVPEVAMSRPMTWRRLVGNVCMNRGRLVGHRG